MHRSSSDKQQAPLPFPSWLKQTYPKKTAVRSFLQMIGALDLAYVMYRTTRIEKNKKNERIEKKKTNETKTAIAAPQIEPEPLILQENPIISTPAAAVPGRGKHAMWLTDPALEDLDLRKTNTTLQTHGISVAFETNYADDEEETMIVVNGTAWRAMLTSPALNLSKMVQILRVSYGELYVLGRMALGAMSGEGYISADDATTVVQSLAHADGKTLDLDVRYHDKDITSKKRTAHTIRIRFERVS